MTKCPCGNPDCLPGQTTIIDIPSGHSILPVEGLASAGQPVLKTAQLLADEGSTPSPSAISEAAAAVGLWNDVLTALAAEGLDLSQYPDWDIIKLVTAAREWRKQDVLLLLGKIQGTIVKMEAEVKRLETYVAEYEKVIKKYEAQFAEYRQKESST